MTGKPAPAGNYTQPKITANPDKKDQFDVTFTPLRDANLSVDIHVNGKPVKSMLCALLFCHLDNSLIRRPFGSLCDSSGIRQGSPWRS